jgi:hypothetical protein
MIKTFLLYSQFPQSQSVFFRHFCPVPERANRAFFVLPERMEKPAIEKPKKTAITALNCCVRYGGIGNK